jgi:hypothetical protein
MNANPYCSQRTRQPTKPVWSRPTRSSGNLSRRRTLRGSGSAVFIAVLLAGCGTTGPVGLTPGETTSAASSSSASPAYDSLKIEIFIDAESVRPVNQSAQLDVGQTVSLIMRSDHDVTVHLEGPELDRDLFVDRMATIPYSFVVDQPGIVVITSDDPAATIATLTVG